MFKENTFYRTTHAINLKLQDGPFLSIDEIVLITSVSMLNKDSQNVSLIFDFKKIENIPWDLETCSWLSEIV